MGTSTPSRIETIKFFSNVKGEGQVMQKVKITFLAITLFLFVVQTSNLSHVVAYGKVNKFLTSNFKGEGQGHVKGQNNIFSETFLLIVVHTSNLSHVVAYGKTNIS